MRVSFLCVLMMLTVATRGRSDPPVKQKKGFLAVRDLHHSMTERKRVSVRFVIDKIDGISQRVIKGQAASFSIRAVPHENKRLGVWVVGDLANDLERLQLGAFHDHQIPVGTTIQVTGKLSVHSMDNQLFHIDVGRLKDFKVIPRKKLLRTQKKAETRNKKTSEDQEY